MKLSIAVDQYVARKRIDGYAFSNEESRLARFCKSSGDLDISDLSSDHVVAYLDGSDVATVTWRQKYFLLLRFFEFLHRRKEIPLVLMPPLKSAVRQTFVPYIYTRQEIGPPVGCDVVLSTIAELHDPCRDVSCSALNALRYGGTTWGSCRIEK